MRFSLATAVTALAASAAAETVTYNFTVGWVQANPDGLYERKVIGINNQWPLPIIEVNKGDQLVVNVYNGLDDKSTSIHWHGMFQNGSTEMDGASMITQCPIPPGSSFTYNFTADQVGSYWYHCHTDYCYPDGYRQAFIIHDPDEPFTYDGEFVFTLTDWYHEMLENLKDKFMSLYNPSGAEPVPDAFLLNDAQNSTFAVEPNKTYLLRLMNTGAFVAQYFYIEDHNLTIVEVDGVYTEPTEADVLYLAIAQRYTVLLTTKNTTDVNYKIVTIADNDLLDTTPSTLQLNNTNWLLYNASAPLEPAVVPYEVSDDVVPFDDFTLVPYDGEALLPDPDITIDLTVYMNNLMTGYNYAMFNNITYTIPKVPSLYTALSAGANLSTNPRIYGEYTDPYVLGHNQVVEVLINNADSGSHPFHLHGHNFQVIERYPSYGPDFASLADGDPVPYDPDNHTAFPATPIRRDTVVLPPNGYVILRFVADNPGVWIFHCHIDWHLSSGLALTFIEAPELLPSRITIPDDHYAACAAASVPSAGNAAGNTANFLDLSGQNAQPATIPDGWTSRGEVAMAFSVLSAVLGMISLVFYGLADLKHSPVGTTTKAGAVAGAGAGAGAASDEEAAAKTGLATTATAAKLSDTHGSDEGVSKTS